MPSVCVCGDNFNVDHAMICKRAGLSSNAIMNWGIWRRKCFARCVMALKLNQFYKKSQEKSWLREANTAPDARLDIVARGFWERQRSAFFDVRICPPNADSYRDMELNQIYRQHETEKKRQYASGILEVEQATFTPLIFSTTGGMAAECKRYHSRLAELLATKTGESYATTMSWIRAMVSFALRTIFYLLLFIVFLGRLPYLKLISYILLSYFCCINVDSRGLKFSSNEHSF